ncbi:type II toxin-antitoxin system HipA family toxin [Novosphingobium naphthalenivorans]|uniref:type II toxin-antitoxin system HipA family toxin n=1 Tax=Novosphingobium naphthalenivorans TaxID=273168 RepID=UPI000833BF59|nr:type II toxin-antitoxin system HipA family toxin [Novosphingobium naphthalenivorans]
MRLLDVWLESSALPIGHLAAGDDGAMGFVYTADWLGQADNHALSLSLPLTGEPFGDAVTRAWFGNLLQENDQLERVMAREGLDRGDIAGLLAHVGSDCAGAVSVLPQGHPPVKRPGNLAEDYDALDDETFRDLVQRLAEGRPLPEDMRDPSPVAGYRRKISLAELPGNRFGLPKPGSGAPTTHILKIPDPGHRHESRHEAFVTRLAAQCGLDVGKCTASDVDGQEVLLIHRFDRKVDGSDVYRLHQEDFAQALGLPATLKYERRGQEGRRFDAAAIARILAETDRPAMARQRFLEITLFDLLVGNNDNHAKNHALFHLPGRAPVLAPFYDLVPVQVVAGYTDELAFRIGEAHVPEDIRREDLLHFCEAIGIPRSGARTLLERAARQMIEAIEEHSARFPQEMRALDNLAGEREAHLNAILELGLELRERDAHIVRGGGWALS